MLLESGLLGVELVPESSTLRLSGEMDAATAGLLTRQAAILVADGRRDVVLDCSELTFCDSCGLRAMLELVEAVRPDGSVTMVEPSDRLCRMLAVTGLIDHFAIVRQSGMPADELDRKN